MSLATALIFAACLLNADSSIASRRDPLVLRETVGGAAITFFVSSAAAFDDTGDIRTELFQPHEVAMLRHTLSGARSGTCVRYGGIQYERVGASEPTSVEDAVRSASLVIRGVVMEKVPGFKGAEPGILLRVATSDVLKGTTALTHFYMFFPVGDIPAGKVSICKTDDAYPREPDIGDDLVVIPRHGGVHRQFLETDAAGVVVIRKEGRVSYPPRFQHEAGAEPSDLLGTIRQAAENPVE